MAGASDATVVVGTVDSNDVIRNIENVKALKSLIPLGDAPQAFFTAMKAILLAETNSDTLYGGADNDILIWWRWS